MSSTCLNSTFVCKDNVCPCLPDQFACGIGDKCLTKGELCDGTYDCPDQSDEYPLNPDCGEHCFCLVQSKQAAVGHGNVMNSAPRQWRREQGLPSPQRQWCISPLVWEHVFPLFSEKILDSDVFLKNFPFSPKKFLTTFFSHSPKFSKFFPCFTKSIVSPCFKKILTFPPVLQKFLDFPLFWKHLRFLH